MTAKQYKRLCRIKANKIAKLITCLLLVGFFVLAEYCSLGGYITASVGTTLWFYTPDVVVYLLELRYRISHDHTSYR